MSWEFLQPEKFFDASIPTKLQPFEGKTPIVAHRLTSVTAARAGQQVQTRGDSLLGKLHYTFSQASSISLIAVHVCM